MAASAGAPYLDSGIIIAPGAESNVPSEFGNVRTSRVIEGQRFQQQIYSDTRDVGLVSGRVIFDRGETVSHPINFPAECLRYRIVKRVIDLSIILISLPLLIPLMLAIAISVKVSTGGPVFFSQLRVRTKDKYFRILKFRTMILNADEVLREHLANNIGARIEWRDTHKLRFDPRVNSVGSFLRRYSLDELPQLWNVVKGDMSLIGPRPISSAEIAKYGSRFACYCRVKPGLSGLWQVSGRSHTTYPQRVSLDCEYVRRWSVALDLELILRSVSTVIRSYGAF